MNPEARITSYLRRELASQRGGRVVRVECRHYKLNSKDGAEIWARDISEDLRVSLEDMAGEIAKECEDDAENMGTGSQRYGVVVYRADKPDKPARPLVVMVNAADQEAEGELETEPANKHGLQSMTMRHLEATQRMLIGSMAAIMGSQQKMVATVTAENEKLREARLEALTTIESVFSQQHERELATEQSRARTALIEDGAKKLMALAPMALAHITGKKSPELAAASRMASLLGELTEAQQMKLAELITSEEFQAKDTQKIALGELLQSINDRSDLGH